MDARFDISRFKIPLIFTAVILLVSLFMLPCTTEADSLRYSLVGQFIRLDWITGNPLLSRIAAIILLANCPVMYYTIDRIYPLRLSTCFPLLYAVLIFSCRNALCLSPIHIAAVFLAWALYYSFRASLEPYDADNPFLAMLMLSVASLFYVPLIWMAPLMTALVNNNSAQKVKTVIGSICGLLLPIAFTVGIYAIATGFANIPDPLFRYAGMAVDIDTGIPQIRQSATLVKVLLMAVSAVWAAISFMTVFHTLDLAASRCHMQCMLYSIWLTVTVLLFGNSAGSLQWILVMIPLVLFLYSFFNKVTQQRIGIFLFSLLLLLIITERIVTLI